MPRSKIALAQASVNAVSVIKREVEIQYPESDPEFVENEVRKAMQVFCALAVVDAIDDMADMIRKWTP